MTQRELAHKMGLSPQTVAQWENDLRNPKIETLDKIAKALGINAERLYTDREREISFWADVEGWQRALDYMGHDFSDDEREIISLFSKLNQSGRKKAVERMEELTLIPKYQKSPSEAQKVPLPAEGETTPENNKSPSEGQ